MKNAKSHTQKEINQCSSVFFERPIYTYSTFHFHHHIWNRTSAFSSFFPSCQRSHRSLAFYCVFRESILVVANLYLENLYLQWSLSHTLIIDGLLVSWQDPAIKVLYVGDLRVLWACCHNSNGFICLERLSWFLFLLLAWSECKMKCTSVMQMFCNSSSSNVEDLPEAL